MQQKIIILDFGSQTTQLIGRRVRELDTFCEILPYNKYPEDDSDVIGVTALNLWLIRVEARSKRPIRESTDGLTCNNSMPPTPSSKALHPRRKCG